ncbi:Mevalonate kinase [Raphanus sativus]|nr:Mevalonate kinase [Raphanus sativus]
MGLSCVKGYSSRRAPAENNDRLTLQLKDLSLEFSWSIARLKEVIPSDSSTSTPALHVQARFLNQLPFWFERAKYSRRKNLAVRWDLHLPLVIHQFSPATVIITTELPYGSGLGSSAAFWLSA